MEKVDPNGLLNFARCEWKYSQKESYN